MSKGSKYLLIIILILIIGLAIYATYIEKNETTNTSANTGSNTNTSTNGTENNNLQNNDVPENKIENTVTPEQNIIQSTTLTDDEKAKELAKQNWGTSEGVYFSVDNVNSNETYVISVRDSATTKVLEWYTVDLKSGTVTN